MIGVAWGWFLAGYALGALIGLLVAGLLHSARDN